MDKDITNPLFQIFVDVDESGSAENFDEALTRLAEGLGQIVLGVSLNKEDLEMAEMAIESLSRNLKEKLSNTKTESFAPDLSSDQRQEIESLIQQYGLLSASIQKVTDDTEANRKTVLISAKDAQGAIRDLTVRFDKENSATHTISDNYKGILELKQEYIALGKATSEYHKASIAHTRQGGEETQKLLDLAKNKMDLENQALIEKINNLQNISEAERQAQLLKEKEIRNAAENSLKEALLQENARQRYAEAEAAAKRHIQLISDRVKNEKKGIEQTDYARRKENKEIKELVALYSGYSTLLEETNKDIARFKEIQRDNKAEKALREEKNLLKQTNEIYKKISTTKTTLSQAEYFGDVQEITKHNEILRQQETILDNLKQKGESVKNAEVKIDLENAHKNGEALLATLEDTSHVAKTLTGQFGRIVSYLDESQQKSLVDLDDMDKVTTATKRQLAATLNLNGEIVDLSRNNSKHKQMTVEMVVEERNLEGQLVKNTYLYDTQAQAIRMLREGKAQASDQTRTFGENLANAAKKIATWGASTKIIYGTIRSMREGVKTIQELDKELVQIGIVQGKSREQVRYLGQEYAQTAFDMARTVDEVSKLNTQLVRQGLTLEESARRADTILKLSSAGMISVQQATAVVTAAVNAMDEAHEKAADVILRASMVSASDVEGIGEAFGKTASSAKAAGLSIEQTTSLISTMKQVTQEGDRELGTSLKSILSRFNRVNEETGEYNKELNDVQKAIESVGVAFLGADGQIRNVYDILEDLSGEWGSLDKNTRAYIATQAAGVRQQNRFFAVMDNFNKTQAIHNDLLGAAGTLQQSYTYFLDGSEASANRLKASVDQMWINAIQSDTLIFFQDVGTAIIKLVDGFGLFNTVLSLTAARQLIFTKELSQAIKNYIMNVKAAGAAKVSSDAAIVASGKKVLANQLAITGALKTTAVALGAFAIQLAAMAAIGLAIAAVVKGIQKLTEASREAREELAKNERQLVSFESAFNTNSFMIEDAGTRFLEYQKKIDLAGGSLSALTSNELQDFYQIQKEMVEVMPNLNHSLDQYENVILHNVNSVEDLNEALREQGRILRENYRLRADEYWEDIEKQRKKGLDLTQEQIQLEKRLAAAKADVAYQQIEVNNKVIGAEANLEDARAKVEMLALEFKEAQEAIDLALDPKPVIAYLSKMHQFSDGLSAALSSDAVSSLFKGVSQEDAEKLFEEVEKALNKPILIEGKNLTFEGLQDKLKELNAELAQGILPQAEYDSILRDYLKSIGAYKNDAEPIFREIAGFMEEFIGQQRRAFNPVEADPEMLAAQQRQALEDAREGYAQATSKAREYLQILDDLNDRNVSYAKIQDEILAKHPQWANLIQDKKALSEAVTAAMLEEERIRQETYFVMADKTKVFLDTSSKAYADYVSALGSYYTGDINNYAELEKSKEIYSINLIKNLGAMWSKYFSIVAGQIQYNRQALESSLQNAASYGAAINHAAKLAEADKIYANLQASLNRVNQSFNNITKEVKITLPTVKDIQTEMDKLAKSSKSAAGSTKEMADAAKAMNEQMSQARSDIEALEAWLVKMIRERESIERKAIEDNHQALVDARKEEHELTISNLEKERDFAIGGIQAQIDALKKKSEEEKYLEGLRNKESDAAKLQAKIEELRWDTSIQGQAERAKLEEEYGKLTEDISKTKADRDYELIIRNYEAEKNFQQELYTSRIDYEKEIHEEWLRMQEEQKTFALAQLDERYTKERVHMEVLEAIMTGHVKYVDGELMTLADAWKRWAYEFEEGYSLLGPKKIQDFQNSITNALNAIKKFGLEAINAWKDLDTQIAKTQASASAGGGSGSTPPPPPPTGGQNTVNRPSGTAEVREFQTLLNLLLANNKKLQVDGSFGPKTKAAIPEVAARLAKGNNESKTMARALANISLEKQITKSFNQALGNVVRAASNSGTSVNSYAKGGKIDYTGPAEVHGSRKRPEYVFNYEQFTDLARMIARHQFSERVPENYRPVQPPSITIDKLISVEGNVTKETIPHIQRAGQDAFDRLQREIKKRGV